MILANSLVADARLQTQQMDRWMDGHRGRQIETRSPNAWHFCTLWEFQK